MAVLKGYVKDKRENAIEGAWIEIKNEQFQTEFEVASDKNGYYEITVPDKKYSFVTIVRDYAEKYLEYWCQNINLEEDIQLDVQIDTLEVYGLHAFCVKGGLNAIMVYFRPMSLEKFQTGAEDISPDLESIKVRIDGQEVSILITNKVGEFAGDRTMTAYLIQADMPEMVIDWKRLDVEIRDHNGAYGAATVFHE